jgi:transcription termination factor Rho
MGLVGAAPSQLPLADGDGDSTGGSEDAPVDAEPGAAAPVDNDSADADADADSADAEPTASDVEAPAGRGPTDAPRAAGSGRNGADGGSGGRGGPGGSRAGTGQGKGTPAGPQGGRGQDGQPSGNQGGGNPGGKGQDGPSAGGPQQGAPGKGGQGNQGGNRNPGNGNPGNGNPGNGPESTDGNGDVDPGNRADPQSPPVEDGEGNRRRRRRGRDRNRPNEDEPVLAEPVDVEGIVDLRDEGYGFLRVEGYLPSVADAYISVKQVRQFGLRRGDVVAGRSRAANRNEKNPALVQVDTVNGISTSGPLAERPRFEDLTAVFPDTLLRLEQSEFPENVTARIIDLLAPIGKGQRGLLVAPPKSGKTAVLKQAVRAIERNHPEVHVIVALVGERPEEITDLRRWMLNGEVAASTFDRPAEEHVALAELVVERAARLVEAGRDVAVVLDGLTRLVRASNLVAPGTGRVLDGVLDVTALHGPKRLFAAARNAEEGGSLTILATATATDGHRLDEVILDQFVGTGNQELRLDRHLAELRLHPAIDVEASSTAHEDLLVDRRSLPQLHQLRRELAERNAGSEDGSAGLAWLIERLKATRSNEAFLAELGRN